MAQQTPNFDMQASDAGTVITITVTDGANPSVAQDISSATTKTFVFRRVGSSTSFTRTAVFDGTGGTNGILQYTTLASDFPVPGVYEVQAHIISAAPLYDRFTSKGLLQVGANV